MKKKMMKRILSVLFASMMLFGCLTACQNQSGTPDDATTTDPSAETVQVTTAEVAKDITVNFHYLRADGNYNGWNVWLWSAGDGSAYQFESETDEKGAHFTTTFAAGTETIGFIVRLNEWEAKDIEDDQFIDTSSIYAGTVDVYVTSGKMGCTLVFGENCVDASGAAAKPDETTASSGNNTGSERDWVGVAYAYDQELNVIDDNYRNYYEIFVRSFYDSDGNGYGDLKGVTSKLDYVAELGFNGIWFMPIMQSPSYHKYDVVDYYSIDSQYGTIEDFKELIEEAHARGINVIIDMVINHSSVKHAWFTTASAYLATLTADATPDEGACPEVGYYHFSRQKESGTWYAVPGTGNQWYYEGQFDSGMPDLNLANTGLRAELENVAKFWIDLGVDGFRMDAALHYEEQDHEFNCEVLNWLYTYCCSLNPDFYMVSEIWDGSSTVNTYYNSKTPSMFNFDTSGAEGIIVKTAKGKEKATSFVTKMISVNEKIQEVYEGGIDAPFLSNHDNVRSANSLVNNEDDMKMAAGLLLTMNGSPFVYYGEEIGMNSKGTTDPNKRLPMVWSKTDDTGITNLPTGADTGIESPFDGVDVQLADEGSLLNYYKRALQLRNENPEIARGEIAKVDGLQKGFQAAITKTWNGSTIAIVYNTADEEVTLDLSGTTIEAMGIRGYLTVDGSEVTLSGMKLTLPAQSIVILK